jgi:hypothetical protein
VRVVRRMLGMVDMFSRESSQYLSESSRKEVSVLMDWQNIIYGTPYGGSLSRYPLPHSLKRQDRPFRHNMGHARAETLRSVMTTLRCNQRVLLEVTLRNSPHGHHSAGDAIRL